MPDLRDLVEHLRLRARSVRARTERFGLRQREEKIVQDAEGFWTTPEEADWRSHSHWREALDDQWTTIGSDSLARATQLAAATGGSLVTGKTVDWGAGGGANAVAFAPQCDEFVAVDVVQDSLDECEEQVRRVCDTKVTKVLIDIESPELAIPNIGEGTCDLFICLYVMELLPSPAYALRVLSIASELLSHGGIAFVQIKYSTDSRQSRPRRRAYRRDLANMTTFGVEEFWRSASGTGLDPKVVQLEPQNQLDERYAYFLLSKP